MNLPKVTQKNYYSPEVNRAYWSASQVKSFLDCEARAKAELDGTYVRPESTALTLGGYVDCALTEPKRIDQFKAEHPEMFKRDGSLKAEFVQADSMIERAMQSKGFMRYLSGQHQKILTGTLFGLPFRAKLDAYRSGQYITDLKTVKDLEPIYKAGQGRMTPIEAWRWDIQGSIYAALEGNDLPFYLAIITKQNPPDLLLVEIDREIRSACLEYLAEKMPRLDAVKNGIIEPERCEHCDYCRSTRTILEPVSYMAWQMEQYE